jgi:hypothetical protein
VGNCFLHKFEPYPEPATEATRLRWDADDAHEAERDAQRLWLQSERHVVSAAETLQMHERHQAEYAKAVAVLAEVDRRQSVGICQMSASETAALRLPPYRTTNAQALKEAGRRVERAKLAVGAAQQQREEAKAAWLPLVDVAVDLEGRAEEAEAEERRNMPQHPPRPGSGCEQGGGRFKRGTGETWERQQKVRERRAEREAAVERAIKARCDEGMDSWMVFGCGVLWGMCGI